MACRTAGRQNPCRVPACGRPVPRLGRGGLRGPGAQSPSLVPAGQAFAASSCAYMHARARSERLSSIIPFTLQNAPARGGAHTHTHARAGLEFSHENSGLSRTPACFFTLCLSLCRGAGGSFLFPFPLSCQPMLITPRMLITCRDVLGCGGLSQPRNTRKSRKGGTTRGQFEGTCKACRICRAHPRAGGSLAYARAV